MPRGDFGQKLRRQWAPDARALSIVGDRWLMVIVRDLASGPLRLDAVRRSLPGVSAGALEARLVRMADAGLVVRRRRRSLPPRVDLELTERGHGLVTVIAQLARWELRSHWSAPRADEWIDIGACFRLAPLLQSPGDGNSSTDGELELTILNANGTPAEHHTLIHHHQRTTLEPRPSPNARTRVSGTQEAWVQALSPNGTATQLSITGDQARAKHFLSLFLAQAP